MKKFINSKLHLIQWDNGFENGNEWVYASINTAQDKTKLMYWLNAKSPIILGPAIELSSNYEVLNTISADINLVECFVSSPGRMFIQINMKWIFEFRAENIARFGRWPE